MEADRQQRIFDLLDAARDVGAWVRFNGTEHPGDVDSLRIWCSTQPVFLTDAAEIFSTDHVVTARIHGVAIASFRKTDSYGPANDDPPEVQIEIRAAELAMWTIDGSCCPITFDEGRGYMAHDNDVTPEDEWLAGWLSHEIVHHDDVEQDDVCVSCGDVLHDNGYDIMVCTCCGSPGEKPSVLDGIPQSPDVAPVDLDLEAGDGG